MTPAMTPSPLRVLVLGATGTAGRATTQALIREGHDVTCLVRRPDATLPNEAAVHHGDVADPAWAAHDLLKCQQFDAIVSCLASRTGSSEDARAIDHAAHSRMLKAAQAADIGQFVLLSAICVQKPRLPFQQAKLAFEAELVASGLSYSIVRPTAFFKSLSGQIARVKAGKPFVMFGDGTLTRCKPISDSDLGAFIARCLTNPDCQNRILPIGGPGPALSPCDQAEMLFELAGQTPRFKRVPVGVMDAIVAGLALAGTFSKTLGERAELARIGRYYATESMLLWDDGAGRYDADATPETGTQTLRDFYAAVLRGDEEVDLGDHAVF